MRERLGIRQVGRVEWVDEHVHLSGWLFLTVALPEGMEADVPVDEGGIAGWTNVELHNIAHGLPCECPVGQIIEAEDLGD
ncbi:MAG: hypothetical protein QOF60_3222 [Actinomycetota bacterium]|jgi:hypothetical protein|nr:hypothetical protein [Actinomycetota bacterium]